MPASIPGIHHVTCITGDVQKCVNFYVSALGLRFIKKSINQDLPDTYHIYFGDYLGTPGSAMTFFGWPTWPSSRRGTGQVTTVSFAVPDRGLDFWSDRLRRLGVASRRSARFGVEAIVLEDPDGIELELVSGPSDDRWVTWRESPVDAEHAIRGFHSVTLTVSEGAATFDLLESTMGFRKSGQEGSRTRLETGEGGAHATLDVIESPEGPAGEESLGTVHHVAWRTPDAETQEQWREKLLAAGRNVTPVIDRWYFKSIYFREPGGVLYEIATDGPGFTVDERPERLGSGLSLPPWFQVRRERLDSVLPPIVVPTTATTGAH
ncbi:MAG TPA: ring-cleaving dioxygenase [Candidatus Dormibacteraeota bacterium]|nr:ring-cleaving dioxygenase [Candidatus Dormibacteraeota bacterium]